jgi:hypothetical protein
MGQAVGGLVKALSCQDCARYVCNSMDLKSKCLGDCCEFELETHEVEIADNTSELSIEVEGCFGLHNK